MKRFSLVKLVAAAALAGGGVIAACSSSTTEPVAPKFPIDRYEQAQASQHSEQLLRTAQADPYARDAGIGSGTRADAGTGGGRDALDPAKPPKPPATLEPSAAPSPTSPALTALPPGAPGEH